MICFVRSAVIRRNNSTKAIARTVAQKTKPHSISTMRSLTAGSAFLAAREKQKFEEHTND